MLCVKLFWLIEGNFIKKIQTSLLTLAQEQMYWIKPLQLLNKLEQLKFDSMFPNVCITTIWIFCTILVTGAEAERSFSKMKLIKIILKSTMGQQRMSLCRNFLAIESDIAKNINYEVIITDFASKKARRHFNHLLL